MCIYYTNRNDLHYKREEHIFLAGLGGIKSLDKGVVSDEFNNDISKLEQSFLRDSIISLPRILLGPGKRGSLSLSKATKSRVHLISAKDNLGEFAVGFTERATIRQIPHIELNFNTKIAKISFDTSSTTDLLDAISLFKQKTSKLPLKIKVTNTDELPEQVLLIGIHETIEENRNCFIFKHPAFILDLNEETIKSIIANTNFDISNPQFENYIPTAHDTAIFFDDHFRIFGKIAFNFLALGRVKMVKAHYFDEIRQWIAYGGKNRYANINSEIKSLFEKLNINIPRCPLGLHY